MPVRFLKKAGIWIFWLLAWQGAAVLVDNDILLAGPWQVCRTLASCLPDPEFWLTLACSLGRISLGFLLALAGGILLGALACRFPMLGEFLEPFMGTIRSIPVASFVILALIWIGSDSLSVFIAFLVVLPIIYTNTCTGLSSASRQLLEMAQVFRMPLSKTIRYIFLPALMPSLTAACQTSIGLAWKSGAAAEVIGLPSHSIGEQLYYSKLYLDTSGLFAWTLVIIAASALSQRLLLGLLGLVSKGGSSRDHQTEPSEQSL